MIALLKNKITARTAADLIGVTLNTILVYAKSGKLRHTKVVSRYFFDKDDVLGLIKPIDPHDVRQTNGN